MFRLRAAPDTGRFFYERRRSVRVNGKTAEKTRCIEPAVPPQRGVTKFIVAGIYSVYLELSHAPRAVRTRRFFDETTTQGEQQ
jgi:hypothetical protein